MSLSTSKTCADDKAKKSGKRKRMQKLVAVISSRICLLSPLTANSGQPIFYQKSTSKPLKVFDKPRLDFSSSSLRAREFALDLTAKKRS